MTFSTFNWDIAWHDLAKIGIAYLLALPVGWDREREEQHVGVRTFPIVSISACGYILAIVGHSDVAGPSRVLQGIVTGIGFVGAGAIVRDGMSSVRGTATAASVWNAGAMGASVALERYEIAIALAALNLFTLKALAPIKKKLDKREQ